MRQVNCNDLTWIWNVRILYVERSSLQWATLEKLRGERPKKYLGDHNFDSSRAPEFLPVPLPKYWIQH